MSTSWVSSAAFTITAAVAMGVVAGLGCDSAPEVDPDVQSALVSHLDAHGMTPDAYVLSAFEDHDVVVVGEHGRIVEDVEFVTRLVPQLAERGVSAIAVPYLCRDDQALIDTLLTRVTYDEAAMINLQRRFDGGVWPYREYVDIAKAVWNVNRLHRGGPQMRLIALSPYVDWVAFHGDDRAAAQRAQRMVAATDYVMAGAIESEVLTQGGRALVYVGRNDAFTRFSRPIVRGGEVVRRDSARLGHQLEEKLGDRVMTILLHAPFPTESGLVSPCDGMLESVFAARPDSVGFDVRGPFQSLVETRSTYAAGGGSVTLGSLCDGYVMLKAIPKLNGVTVIQNWLPSDDAFEEAKMRLPNRAQADGMDSPRDYLAEFQRTAAIGSLFGRMN